MQRTKHHVELPNTEHSSGIPELFVLAPSSKELHRTDDTWSLDYRAIVTDVRRTDIH